MKLAIGFVAAILLALPAAPVAAQVDCEAARCAVQAAVNTACPCDQATNHGQHVSCVAHVVKDLSRQGLVPTNCKGKVKRCASRSTCGKPGFVTCNVPTDTCDPATLTCTGNPAVTCATDFDCGTRCSTKSSIDKCTALGGVAGTGTCCVSCGP